MYPDVRMEPHASETTPVGQISAVVYQVNGRISALYTMQAVNILKNMKDSYFWEDIVMHVLYELARYFEDIVFQTSYIPSNRHNVSCMDEIVVCDVYC